MKFDCNMKATAPTIFSEQLSTVIDLFQRWNDCERAVMLCALLKKCQFPTTKFLQSVIDTSLQQAQCKEQVKKLERNANCAKYINSLSETYKSFKYNDSQLTPDSIFFESDRSLDKIDKYYDKKEEILHDIVKMMPILTIGNDEAKAAYLEFIPMTVGDATRRNVSSTLVQQIVCYVLIHPAFSTDDRGSVFKYIKDLEALISSNEPNFFLYGNGSTPTSETTNPPTPSHWQAIVPPITKSTETIPSPWGSSHLFPRTYNDDNDYRNPPAPISSTTGFFVSGGVARDTSFQHNGTNVDDSIDTNTSNTQIGYISLPRLTDHLMVQKRDEVKKTERSQSLTLPLDSQTVRTSSAQNPTVKPWRSNSWTAISMDKPKEEIQSPQHHVGMSNIGQWLKSLRLHKYFYLFQQITYEQMLNITEEQLLTVTIGARHKLVNCIQKLKERYGVLCQMEKDLLCGQIAIDKALDELSNIVLTPMKPLEQFHKQDVANQFLKVLVLVSTKMTAKHIEPKDEDYINGLLWILTKAEHNEAFVANTNLLKEHHYKVQRIKSQFPPKSHHSVRQRPTRPIKFIDYLPTRPSPPFTGVTRSIGPLPYNRPKPFTFDQDVFKMPQLPINKVAHPIQIGSLESISSGYHSDGFTPIGMNNIHKWLKSLRLHKYTWVFDGVSYEKMFSFTEEHLASLNITQGARTKLANCIEKLKTRNDGMKQIGLILSQNELYVPEAINEMESMIFSPMKPMRLNCDTDVGYQLWKVLNLVFNLLASKNYDEQTVQSFHRLVESSMNSEAFIDYICTLREMKMRLARLGRRMIR